MIGERLVAGSTGAVVTERVAVGDRANEDKKMLMNRKSPGEQDWDWIIEKHIQTAWESLPAEIRSNFSLDSIRENLNKQTEKFIEDHGFTNQIFIIHTGEHARVGYIWVGKFRNGFTGEDHAHIINIYVKSDFQGKGIGKALLQLAEDWARQQQLRKITLNVASHNLNAIHLYGKIGFQNEAYRMAKLISHDP